MKKSIFVFAVLFVRLSQAQLLDDGLSPFERWMSGSKAEGAYSVYQPLYCSQTARNKYLKNLKDENALLTPNGPSVSQMLKTVNQIVNETQTMLVGAGDIVVESRQICTGFYHETESLIGNAQSTGAGYLVFDFRMFQHLYSLPDEQRSSWVADFLVLHEFSHQLQYWNDDPEVLKAFRREQSSRVPELAADCLAGALLTMKNHSLPAYLYDISFNGAVNAAFLLGDYQIDMQDHHGTPVERYLATSIGADFVRNHVKITKSIQGLTSAALLNVCNRAAKRPI